MTKTKEIDIGDVTIGGDNRPVIQSMTNTDTENVKETVEQINELEEYGCDIARIAIPNDEAAESSKYIKKYTNLPLVADIHFNHELALKAAEYVDKLRINPGNIGGEKEVREVVEKAKEQGIPIRVGVNSGSIEKEFKDYPMERALELSTIKNAKMLERQSYGNMVLSAKSSDVPTMVKANRRISESDELENNYPLHLGVTEAGPKNRGSIKNAIGIGSLLLDGIGDTIRVSLSADPKYEVIRGKQILSDVGLYDMPEVISCPTCGRTRMDVEGTAEELEEEFAKNPEIYQSDLRVTCMGCNVNGPGEAEKSDLGIVGNARNDNILFYENGEVVDSLESTDKEEILDKFYSDFLENYKK